MSAYHYKLSSANAKRQLTPEWFMRKVEKTPTCWWWTGSKNGQGYGLIMLQSERFSADGKRHFTSAHRVAWQLFSGEIPGKLCVLHTCDQPRCVNPAHLFLGTTKDNSIDCARKGRNHIPELEERPHGTQFNTTLITERAVWRLRFFRAQGMTEKEAVLATFLSASRSVMNGRNWRHLGNASPPPTQKDVATQNRFAVKHS